MIDLTFGLAKSSALKYLARTRCIGAGLLFFMGLSGCMTSAAIQDVMLPYTTVRSIVVKQMPMGVRKESANGRELTSNYFASKSLEDDPGDAPTRAYAEVVILGSSRPYEIAVKVVREHKSKKTKSFVRVGEDKKLTKDLTTRLLEALANRREDSNVIDDFRAF